MTAREEQRSGTYYKPLILFLYVDGQRDTRVAYSVLLRRAGYRVMESGNGVNGVECVLTFKPDVVILDLSISLEDGHEAMRRLEKNALTANTPVLILSGCPIPEDASSYGDAVIEMVADAARRHRISLIATNSNK